MFPADEIRHYRAALHQHRGQDKDKVEFVPRATLGGSGWPTLDVLKIDAEGTEFEVLAGAAQTIARRSPEIMIDHLKVDAAALANTLKSLSHATSVDGLRQVGGRRMPGRCLTVGVGRGRPCPKFSPL